MKKKKCTETCRVEKERIANMHKTSINTYGETFKKKTQEKTTHKSWYRIKRTYICFYRQFHFNIFPDKIRRLEGG